MICFCVRVGSEVKVKNVLFCSQALEMRTLCKLSFENRALYFLWKSLLMDTFWPLLGMNRVGFEAHWGGPFLPHALTNSFPVSFHLTASGSTDWRGKRSRSEGGPFHHAAESVHPEHSRGLPAKRRVRFPPTNQEAPAVQILHLAHTLPPVSIKNPSPSHIWHPESS